MCRSSSCRFRKYHGAFDGFGVTSGFARFSSGALMNTERITNVIVNSSAADELDEDEVRPDEQLLFALALGARTGRSGGWSLLCVSTAIVRA